MCSSDLTKELKSSRANTQIAPASPFTLSSAKGRHPTTQNNVRSRIPDGRTTSQLAYRWRPCRLLRPQIPAKAAIKAGPTHVFSKPADFYIQGTIDPRLTMRYVRKAVRNPARGQLSKPAAVRANKLHVRRNLQVPGHQPAASPIPPKGMPQQLVQGPLEASARTPMPCQRMAFYPDRSRGAVMPQTPEIQNGFSR